MKNFEDCLRKCKGFLSDLPLDFEHVAFKKFCAFSQKNPEGYSLQFNVKFQVLNDVRKFCYVAINFFWLWRIQFSSEIFRVCFKDNVNCSNFCQRVSLLAYIQIIVQQKTVARNMTS